MSASLNGWRRDEGSVLWWVTIACAVAAVGLLLAPRVIRVLPAGDTQPAESAAEASAWPTAQTSTAGANPTQASAGSTGAAAEHKAARDEATAPLDCLIEPFEVVEIGSAVVGVIQRIPVERGQMVQAGQVVAELESSVEQATVKLERRLANLQAGMESREKRVWLQKHKRERAAQLYASQAVSLDARQEFDTEAEIAELELLEARENRELAALKLARAKATLGRRVIRSPISGVVVDRKMSRGEVVDDETILTIAQIDPLRVDVILPSARYGTIETGMNATVVPEIPGDEVHIAQVKIVDRVIDAASGTFGVQLELPNADLSIPGGLHCQARFDE